MVLFSRIHFLENVTDCVISPFCRWFKRAGDSYIKVPFLGPISYLTLAVSPFCIVFAVLWAVYRERSLAWIGQDILVRIAASYDFIFNYNPILSDGILTLLFY